jgi:hypothetical protein
MASHAHRIGLLELPRPGRAALPLLALALAALGLEADPSLRIAGAAAAGCFTVAATVRIARARVELRRIRRSADRLILADTVGAEGSEIVRWRSHELVAPAARRGLARELDQTLHRLDRGLLPSASPLRRVSARRHEDLFERLAERMLDERPVTPRGVLLLRRLLREPGSPLYDDGSERELARALAAVLAELGA